MSFNDPKCRAFDRKIDVALSIVIAVVAVAYLITCWVVFAP